MFLSYVTDHKNWEAFLTQKLNGGHLNKTETKTLKTYVDNKEYQGCVAAFVNGVPFCHPSVGIINKQFSAKKRTVFLYPTAENLFLKFISFYLLKFDGVFTPSLCSFRKNITVKTVIKSLVRANISKKYSYKVDISDYFNSVDTDTMLPMLENVLSEDRRLFEFIKALLKNPYAIKNGNTVTPKKGIMAGVPVSAFLANLYLKKVDEYFWNKGILYIRYSDDIILFADTKEQLEGYIEKLKTLLSEYKLKINTGKEAYTAPGEKIEFLGFSYLNGVVDISAAAVDKMKKKMKRKARALYRWKLKNKASDIRAVKAFIKSFNKRFYNNDANDEITWTRWYFPVINTDISLHRIDVYMQDCIRYIVHGNYSKQRYNFRYQDMKDLGYISLVNSYYKFIKQ